MIHCPSHWQRDFEVHSHSIEILSGFELVMAFGFRTTLEMMPNHLASVPNLIRAHESASKSRNQREPTLSAITLVAALVTYRNSPKRGLAFANSHDIISLFATTFGIAFK